MTKTSEDELRRVLILLLRSAVSIQQQLAIPGWEDLRRQADEMEKRAGMDDRRGVGS